MNMYRYHLKASFEKDLYTTVSEVDQASNNVVSTIPFLRSDGSLRYGIQKTIIELSKQQIYPSEPGIDAIIFGMMVYIADMKISRKKQSQDSWTREFKLTIPVFDVRWASYTETFEKMLRFLTGDIWRIKFADRKISLADNTKSEERTDKYRQASLFSGGMDSLIAAINHMEQGQATLLVSHAGESRVRNWQKNLLDVLDKRYEHIPHENAYLWTSLSDIILPEADKDMNQRSRSFLFITIAILAMSGTRCCTELQMPENGLIALNVPLDCLRLGSHSTRTTHPYYLKLWNEVVAEIFNFTIINPYWNKTKGEMATECLNKALLKEIVAKSFSCSSVNSANIRTGLSQHCGHCLPCIIRRAAIHRAFPKSDPSRYMDSEVSKLINNRETKGEQIRSFQYAIEKVKKNTNAKTLMIHKSGPLEDDDEYLSELAEVYFRGLMEVEQWICDSLESEHVS